MYGHVVAPVEGSRIRKVRIINPVTQCVDRSKDGSHVIAWKCIKLTRSILISSDVL